MQEYIDREFEQLPQDTIPEDPAVITVRNTLFVRMLILSLLVHLALVPLAVLPGKRSAGIPFTSM